MKNARGKKPDSSFKIDRARLLEMSKISPAGRLQWLEEANNFIASIDNGKLKRRWLSARDLQSKEV